MHPKCIPYVLNVIMHPKCTLTCLVNMGPETINFGIKIFSNLKEMEQ